MECSICFDAITKETGSATLSCEHSFHFRCIDSWFTKQVWDDIPQTCPCCRSEGTNMDRCSVAEFSVADGEEEDDDDDDDDETAIMADSETISVTEEELNEDLEWVRMGPGRWAVNTLSHRVFENFRSLFSPLNEPDWEDNKTPEAAVKIQAAVRGHLTRTTFRAVRVLMALAN